MIRDGKMLALGLCGLGFFVGANAILAVAPGNPYLENITNRNVFHLTAPPPPFPVEPNQPAPSRITLTGIMTILGKKQALMRAQGQAKPGQAPADQYYILAEGQWDGDIEVLEIDELAGTVKVKNAGIIETLSFADNGVKQAPSPHLNLAGLNPTAANLGSVPGTSVRSPTSARPLFAQTSSQPTSEGQPGPVVRRALRPGDGASTLTSTSP